MNKIWIYETKTLKEGGKQIWYKKGLIFVIIWISCYEIFFTNKQIIVYQNRIMNSIKKHIKTVDKILISNFDWRNKLRLCYVVFQIFIL